MTIAIRRHSRVHGIRDGGGSGGRGGDDDGGSGGGQSGVCHRYVGGDLAAAAAAAAAAADRSNGKVGVGGGKLQFRGFFSHGDGRLYW